MDTYTFTIQGNPVPKKNSMRPIRTRDGRTMLLQAQRYLDYDKSAKLQLSQQRNNIAGFACIDYPVNVQCIFFRGDRRRTDLVNLENSICDILTEAKIISDDNYNIVAGMDGSRVYYDKDNPRVEITITPIDA